MVHPDLNDGAKAVVERFLRSHFADKGLKVEAAFLVDGPEVSGGVSRVSLEGKW